MLRIGRYLVFEPIGAGGMAAVHIGRMLGPLGFSRTVAIKRLHPHLISKDGELITMLIEEARIAARIQHPAVIQTIDIVSEQGEVLLVMDYLHGESLAKLLRAETARGEGVPLAIAATIAMHMLRGLHVAHEATDEAGKMLDLVHRDISPQNILVGAAGEIKVIDFGIAKALGRAPTTRTGQLKGKLSYMSPEQLQRQHVDRRADVFAAGIVLWEMIVGARLFAGDDAQVTFRRISSGDVPIPSAHAPNRGIDPALDAIVMKALSLRPEDRYQTAAAMADALEARGALASSTQIGDWVTGLCGASLEIRRDRLTEIERDGATRDPPGEDTSMPPSADTMTRSSIDSAFDVAVDTPPAAGRKRRSPGGLVALLALAMLAAAVVALRALWPASSAGSPNVASTTGPSSLPSSSVRSATSAEVAPSVSQASEASTATPSPEPPSPRRTPTTSTSPPPHPPAPSVDCRNPYVLDARGFKRYRRECLRR